ncbi:MAG: type II toxin-antitoxin system PemK/MazF family toxin [Aestuariivita sp.]|nr:type II toxin-antitoxin system PemK/MazF family toxin [Aestuariivita sp.]MCY4203832.1 type II toxin-antitoxin system PemK/MazF family toxin [Aestuariivita sp.]
MLKQPRHPQSRIKSAPQLRQIYWCDFPADGHHSEFTEKIRPVVIMSKNAKLHGNVTVLPLTTKPQPDNPMAFPIINPANNQRSWVICDYPITLALRRLWPPGVSAVPRVEKEIFDRIVALMWKLLPQPLKSV